MSPEVEDTVVYTSTVLQEVYKHEDPEYPRGRTPPFY